jgi:hypothetical protein
VGCVATLKVGLGWAMVTGLLFAGLAAMSVVSAVSAFAQADAALKKRGELLLATNCSQCHAIGHVAICAAEHHFPRIALTADPFDHPKGRARSVRGDTHHPIGPA